MTKNDFMIRPQLEGFLTPEPSLEHLVFNYYRQYFTADESLALSDRYIETLLAMKDPVEVM